MYKAASASVSNMRMTGATLSHNLGKNLGEDDDQQPQPLIQPNPNAAAAPVPAWTPPIDTTGAAPSVTPKVWTPPQ
jgi:hypothetical protein